MVDLEDTDELTRDALARIANCMGVYGCLGSAVLPISLN
jgi:hypothetical protein